MAMRIFGYTLSNSCAAVVVAGLLFCGPLSAAPLAGKYSSPFGAIAISEKNGVVKGTLLDPKNVCGFPKGMAILEGTRLDDSVVGTLHACRLLTDTCAGPIDGPVLLLITRGGAVISGAVHLEAGACKTLLGGESLAFKRISKKRPAAVAAATGSKEGSARERALKLASEAARIMGENEGNAELARNKLQQAVTIDPTYSEGYIGVGVTYYARERYDEAIEWYKKGLEANPANGDAYYNIGCIYALKGNTEQALRYLRIAQLNGYVQLDTLKTDPDLKSLHGNPSFEKLKVGELD